MRELAGRRIVLGIRPENIQQSGDARDAATENMMDAEVDLVEPMGPYVDLYLRRGGHSFTARIPGNNRVRVNQRVSFIFAMDQAHFFDATTEKRIG
jgi:multiple sugar transport system ATP-binding protein